MNPEQQRQLMAYLQLLMSGEPQSAQIGQDLFPVVDKKIGDTNYMQDRVQILGDPLMGALSGLGGFDVGAFQPTYERTTVEAPGAQAQQQWASAPEGSATRTMHDLMYPPDGQPGLDAAGAYEQVAMLASEGALTGLPPDAPNQYGEITEGSGLYSLYDQAQRMQSDLASDPSGAMYDDQLGTYYTNTEVPSELAAQFTEMGLPNPTDTYDPQSFVDQGQGSAQRDSEFRDAMTRRMMNPSAPGARDFDTPFDPSAPAPFAMRGSLDAPDQPLQGSFVGGTEDMRPAAWTGKPSYLGGVSQGPEFTGRMAPDSPSLRPPPKQGMRGGNKGQAFRRAMQERLNQNTRDTRQRRMETPSNISSRDMGALMRARDDGRTQFTDAIQQRMLMQQIGGL